MHSEWYCMAGTVASVLIHHCGVSLRMEHAATEVNDMKCTHEDSTKFRVLVSI